MLLCRVRRKIEPETDYLQAYLVDPENKKQLASARHWATYTEYGDYDYGTREYAWKIEHEPIEFEFDNTGFNFELLDCAGGSSQGGKLSFWNCIVSKDDKRFKIGINSDMLLEILKEGSFEKGKCTTTICFASKKVIAE